MLRQPGDCRLSHQRKWAAYFVSHTRKRRRDGAEIFAIKKQRHAECWMAQAFPVLLVIRNSEGEVRWMEVRDWLKRASDNGKKPVKQIVFDVMSVRRWREEGRLSSRGPEPFGTVAGVSGRRISGTDPQA